MSGRPLTNDSFEGQRYFGPYANQVRKSLRISVLKDPFKQPVDDNTSKEDASASDS
jgi:hypothetical protein